MSKLVHVIDVNSGNLQSLTNAITSLGFDVKFITNGNEIELENPDKLILPGVGNFGHFVKELHSRNFIQPIKNYIDSGKPIMGICVGLQTLFESSEESPNIQGLSILKGNLSKFNSSNKSVPQIGWNGIKLYNNKNFNSLYGINEISKYYFVHSYAAIRSTDEINKLIENDWNLATCTYLDETFIAAVSKNNIFATQFHPEKSGLAGLKVIKNFLNNNKFSNENLIPINSNVEKTETGLTRRIVACLDVRTNDQGDLVVTKGDQYDVREKTDSKNVRNLGKPVEMAEKYYKQGADEVTFLNITSFRNSPIKDLPMLEVLKLAAKTCFVPLTVGGGIKDLIDPIDGKKYSALNVASMYFNAGADKVSIGSDAVRAAEEFYENGCKGSGNSPIETISKSYGVQAVVISVDPKRFYIKDPSNFKFKYIKTNNLGPNGEEYCYYKVTSQGGRKVHDLGAVELATACEKLGAGEILLNCIDKDGSNSGYDFELINMVKSEVSIPVISSSGAGNPQHFVDVFRNTKTDAALGAGMFHRGEYTVKQVKDFMTENGLLVRIDNTEL